MDAIRHHTFGPPEVLQLEQIPDPTPGGPKVWCLIASMRSSFNLNQS